MQYDEDEVEHIYLDDDDDASPVIAQGEGVTNAVDNSAERQKLKKIFIGTALIAFGLMIIRGIELQRFIADFLAVFMIAFSAIKIADIESFAEVYHQYDLIAKRVKAWGFILPFILAFMGFWYLLSEAPFRLDVLAMAVSGTAVVGAFKSAKSKSRRQYAFHKTLLRLPSAKVTLLENSVIFALACLSLFV